MPSVAYMVVTGVTVLGLALNLLNFASLLPAAVFDVWQDFAGIVGLAVLPQVRRHMCCFLTIPQFCSQRTELCSAET